MIDPEKTLEDLKLLNALCHGTVLDDAIAILKEQINESKRNPVIICPHCGKRVK